MTDWHVRRGPRGPADRPHRLVGHARGEIELERQVLVINRIHVTYTGVELPDGPTDAFERALAAHADGCPVARSLRAPSR